MKGKLMRKGVISLLLVVVLVMSSMTAFAAGASGTMTAADVKAAAVDGVVTLDGDVTMSGKLNLNEDLTIDLNGNTLKLTTGDNDVAANSHLKIKNGTIDISGITNAGDGIIRVGTRGTSGTLTLEDVVVTGKDIQSGAGTFMLYEASALNLTDSKINIENEIGTQAYIIYSNAAGVTTVNITNSDITAVDGNSGIFNGNVTFTDSTFTMSGSGDNGFNSITGTENNIKFVNSTVEISDITGRPLTVNLGDVTLTNSTLNFDGDAESEDPDILFRGAGQIIITDDVSSISYKDSDVADGVGKTFEELVTVPEGIITETVDGVTVINPQVDFTVTILVDGKEIEDGSYTVAAPKGYVFTEDDIKELNGLKEELSDEALTLVGFFWDKEGKDAIVAGDTLTGDATLYVLAKTAEATPTPDTTPSTGSTSPNTGDVSPVGLYVVILAAAAVAVGGFRMRKTVR